MERRIPVPRYLFRGPAKLFQAQGAVAVDITVLNISTNGCRVRGLGPVAEEEVCELAITWQGKEFRQEAKVRWKNDRGDGGLEFLRMDERGIAFLTELFGTLRLEPPRPQSAT